LKKIRAGRDGGFRSVAGRVTSRDSNPRTELTRAQRGGWQVKLLEPDVDTTTAIGRGIVNVLVCFAQMQAEPDTEKQRAVIAARHARGDRVGRPRQIPADVRRRIVRERGADESLSAIARRSKTTPFPRPRARANTVRSVLIQEGVIQSGDS
jgi:DNA invertase Pin-like site-specific DNA recombinase